jgi:hypothetical protein
MRSAFKTKVNQLGKAKQTLFLVITLFLSCAFQQSCTHTLSIESEPPAAKVFGLDTQGNRGTLLGLTPLTLQQPTQEGMFLVEVAKEGFDTKQIVAPVLSSGRQDYKITLNPLDQSFFETQYKKEKSALLSAAFGKLLLLQSSILSKRTSEVLQIEKELNDEFDQVGWFHSLMGNHHYLTGNRAEARKRFARAFELDPDNSEAASMLRLLGNPNFDKKPIKRHQPNGLSKQKSTGQGGLP